ncbi:hypothetical protein SEUCBS140593_004112 [Sporothrix eucalyptigena]|uniref:Uncharacterized protein n=1 Tax=Sporothrix eucalyptigena TaxID=1812306 RepID=A0ABP0BKV2_9PEZI
MTAPVSAHAHLGVPSPEWTEFSSKHPERLVQLVGTPEHMRSMMAAMKSKTATLVPAITEGIADVRDAQVPVSDGSTITVRIYTPDDGKTSRPGLV